MNWALWVLLLVPPAVPAGSLVADRIFGIPARRQWLLLGVPAASLFFAVLGYAIATDGPLAELVGWGVLAGVLGTIFLDAVRLVGVRYGAFPADMPQLFGTIALGLAPRFQRNMMTDMIANIASMPEKERQAAVEVRVKALASMGPKRRKTAMTFMMAGVARLPDSQRQTMLATQMGILATLPEESRRKVMQTMDALLGGNPDGHLPYGQPRGMPKIPMATFRRLATVALPRTWAEGGVSFARTVLAGYFWHFVIGAVTLGIPYFLIFGYGSANPAYAWGIAMGWGTFAWLMMMVLMPPMMPMVRFPWRFPVVPFIAHIAMAVPFALVAVYLVGESAHLHSLVGALR